MARLLLFVAFALSGFTGLIYESIWTHYLKQVLGHAAFAQTLVLALFMGGMALGGWLASRIGPRLRNRLAAYAVAEALIGAYALVFDALFNALEAWSFGQVIPALGSPAQVDLWLWALAVALLLPPSVLLGATFPLMSSAVLRRFPGRDGGHLATLYFTNSLGAASGALVASFVFIGWLGLPGTLALAGLLNGVVAALAGWVARGAEPQPATVAAPEGEGLRLPRLFVAAAFVTGAASFVYEIVWIRMLSLVLGSSFHAFELMLSAFIAGLAFGSLAIRRRIDRIADPLAASAWIQVAMGLLAMATLPVYALSFDWMAALVKGLPKTDAGWLQFNLASHAIAFAVMLPATFMAGMTLPLFTHVLVRGGHGERSIGRIYAANSLGAIAGVMLAVHLLLPTLGLKFALALGAMADIALGLVLLQRAGVANRTWVAAFASLLLPLLLVRAVSLDPAVLGGGVYRTGVTKPEGARTLFHRDGRSASITVNEFQGSVGVISTNGKPDAALQFDPTRPARADEVTMVLLAALPLAIKPDAQRIANIGFGSGLTTHVMLTSPTVREVATIEIEPAVVDGARAFVQRVGLAYSDPRSAIHIADARSWFARQRERWDLIVSEPSNPWVSGVSSLFSDEFYARIGSHLTEQGLLVQWLHLYEFDRELMGSVFKALERHFADYVVYSTDGLNLMIVASPRGRVPPVGDSVFRVPGLARELDRVQVRTLDDLLLRRLGTRRDLSPLVAAIDAPVNAERQPFVELNAPRARFLGRQARDLDSLAASPLPLLEMLAPPAERWRLDRVTLAEGWRVPQLRQAMAVRNQLLTGQGPDGPAAAWSRGLQGCAALDTPAGRDALLAAATATLGALDAASLQPLWAQPDWLGCAAADQPAAARPRLELVAAIARRDGAAMLAQARQLLSAPATEGDLAWRRYALGAGMLGAHAVGDIAAARALWESHGPTLHADGRLGVDILLLAGRS